MAAATQQSGRGDVTLGVVRFTGHRRHMTIQLRNIARPSPLLALPAPIASSQRFQTGRRGDNPLQLSALPHRPISAPVLPLLMPLSPTGWPLSRKHPWHHHPSPPQAPPFHPSNSPETTRLNSSFSCISKYSTARYIYRRRTNPSCSASTPSTPPASTLHCSVSRATLLREACEGAAARVERVCWRWCCT